MFKKILAPTDGSEVSERIAAWTASMARPLGAEVVLLTVIDPRKVTSPGRVPVEAVGEEVRVRAGGGPGQQAAARRSPVDLTEVHAGPAELAPAVGTQVIERVVVLAERYLDAAAKQLSQTGIKVSAKVDVGPPAERIVKNAAELGADMISMATQRESAIARGILGSVTDRVIRSAPVPVLAVHPKGGPSYGVDGPIPRTVFVPLDGSSLSASAVPVGIQLAKALGAEVEFISVLWRYFGAEWPDQGWEGPGFKSPEYRHRVLDYVDQFVDQAKKEGVIARARTAYGSPAQRIIEETEAVEGGMLVMTPRGASGFERWALGSVTDKVIRSSGHPVLVIPPGA